MTLSLTSALILEKSIKSLFLLAIIFLVRPILNKKAFSQQASSCGYSY